VAGGVRRLQQRELGRGLSGWAFWRFESRCDHASTVSPRAAGAGSAEVRRDGSTPRCPSSRWPRSARGCRLIPSPISADKRCAGEAGASGEAELRVLLREASTSERASEASTATQRDKRSHRRAMCVESRQCQCVSVSSVPRRDGATTQTDGHRSTTHRLMGT
jgi:hypothetical protein